MATATSNTNSNIPVLPEAHQKPNAPSGNNNSGTTPEEAQLLSDLLRAYEKAKATIAKALLQNNNETSARDLKGSALDKALGNNPVWQGLLNGNNATGATSTQYDSGDIKNFFFLIFKFLRDHRDGDSKLQVAQAVNMVAEEGMLDDITKESTASLDKMKSDIANAQTSPSARRHHRFWTIFFPIIMVVATIAITLITAGVASAFAGAADAAALAAETGAEAGAEVAASGVDAAVDVSAEVGEESVEMTNMADEIAPEETTNAGATNAAKAGAANAARNAALKYGLVAFSVTAGTTGMVCPIMANQADKQVAQEIQVSTNIEQGEMAVNAAASDAAQTSLKQDMQYQQNAQSEQEADSSLLQQMIQSMTQILRVGSF